MSTPDKATEIKAFLAAIAAFFTALWGWLGWAVLILVICMGLDWITGSWAARRKGEWSSSVARDGLWHKLGEIVALLVAALCDIAIKVILNSAAADLLKGWEYGNYMTLLVAVWYIFTELGSIAENVDKLGAPLPSWLKKAIRFLRAKAEAADPVPEENVPDTNVGHVPAGPTPEEIAAMEAAAEQAADPDPDAPVLQHDYTPKHAKAPEPEKPNDAGVSRR